MAYQAESAIWRNMYLVAARELENGPPQTPSTSTQSADLVAATPTSYILDLLAVRAQPGTPRRATATHSILVFPERNESFAVTIANGVLVHEAGVTVRRCAYDYRRPRRFPAGDGHAIHASRCVIRDNPHHRQQASP